MYKLFIKKQRKKRYPNGSKLKKKKKKTVGTLRAKRVNLEELREPWTTLVAHRPQSVRHPAPTSAVAELTHRGGKRRGAGPSPPPSPPQLTVACRRFRPEIFTIPGVNRMRHEATGQPYRCSRQQVAWKTPWNFEQNYLVQPSARPEPLREPQYVPQWRETEQFRACSLYGSGRPEFHDTIHGLLVNDPEAVFSDPNNPLLKQLLEERESRRQRAAGSKLAAARATGSRPVSSASRAMSARATTPVPSSSASRRPPSTVDADVPPQLASAAKGGIDLAMYNIRGPAQIAGIGEAGAWSAAAASLRGTLGGPNELSGGGGRYYLVNSIASQPNSSTWLTVPLRALAREEQAAAAKEDRARGISSSGSKASVPLHGELRARDFATNRARARRHRVARDVSAVRDLL